MYIYIYRYEHMQPFGLLVRVPDSWASYAQHRLGVPMVLCCDILFFSFGEGSSKRKRERYATVYDEHGGAASFCCITSRRLSDLHAVPSFQGIEPAAVITPKWSGPVTVVV